LVNVLFSVADRDGNRVGGLTRQDFEVFDNGRPQPITHFAEDDSAPLTFALLLQARASSCDCASRGLGPYLDLEKQAVELFLSGVFRPADTALLASLGDGGTKVWQSFTSSTGDLRSALALLAAEPDSGHTDLFDAVSVLTAKALMDRPGRKVLLILSDVTDYDIAKNWRNVVKAARDADTVIFGLDHLDGRYPAKQVDSDWNRHGNLQVLAESTGGRVFESRGTFPLGSFLAAIGDQARPQYALGYPPPEAGKKGDFHRIEVRCRRRGVRVRARSGYYEGAL
jgi:Ca-activated chloride channel family protein